MWTHKTKFKGKKFTGNYEFNKNTGKRDLHLIHVQVNGKKIDKNVGSRELAEKKLGWIFIKGNVSLPVLKPKAGGRVGRFRLMPGKPPRSLSNWTRHSQ